MTRTRQVTAPPPSTQHVQRQRGAALAPPRYGVAAVDAPVQREGDGGQNTAQVHEAARFGASGGGGALPYLDRIQKAFGGHDLSRVVAHTGATATAGAHAMGASAYASGDHVVFAGTPSLHTVAHEVTHVLQQRAGVHLKGGVGQVGDVYERQADAVADRVVGGGSVSDMLNLVDRGGASTPAIQRVPIATAGGEWETTTYRAWGPSRPDPISDMGVGAEIALKFTPGAGSPKKVKIGLIQTVTALKNGAADPTGDEAVPLNQYGRAIDRSKGDGVRNSNPVYGSTNTKTSTATKLKHNVAATGENTYGMRYHWGANKPATLWDMPSSDCGHSRALSKTFETAAVVLEGSSKGTWLGSVTWGYQRIADRTAAPTLIPLARVNNGNPSADFLQAAAEWNTAGDNEGTALVQIPIPV